MVIWSSYKELVHWDVSNVQETTGAFPHPEDFNVGMGKWTKSDRCERHAL